jgi:predicted Zn-dependent peptidase
VIDLPGVKDIAALNVWRTGQIDAFATSGAVKQVVGARLYWPGGPAMESTAGRGAHAVMVQALVRSRAPGSDVPLAELLEASGVSVTAGVTQVCSYLDLRGPRAQVLAALRLTAVSVLSGVIETAAYEVARAAVAQQADRQGTEVRTIAALGLRAARTSPDSYFARPAEEVAEELSFAEVTAAAHRLAEQHTYLVIAGDHNARPYLDNLAVLAHHDRARAVLPSPGFVQAPPVLTRVRAIRPNQGYAVWGTAVRIDGPADHAVLELATHLLGGWSGSRWNTLFREELGLTYGTVASASSYQFEGEQVCLAQVGFAVPPTALTTVEDLILQQVKDFTVLGATEPELSQATAQLLRSEAHYQDSARKLMARTASFLQSGVGPGFASARMNALAGLRSGAFNDRLRQLLAEPTLVMVGPS